MKKIKKIPIIKANFESIYKKLINVLLLIFFLYIKMVNKYYQKHKERLQKYTSERYQNHFEEQKNKRRKKARERY